MKFGYTFVTSIQENDFAHSYSFLLSFMTNTFIVSTISTKDRMLINLLLRLDVINTKLYEVGSE